MKKVFLFAAILFAGVSVVNAQSATNEVANNGEATTTLKIVMTGIQYIEVLNNSSESGDNVLISYNNIADYATEKTSNVVQDHLRVSAVGPFRVTVKAEDDLKLTNEVADGLVPVNSVIEASSIKFNSSLGTEATALTKATYVEGVSLSTSDEATLVTSTTGGMNKTISMEYIATGDYSEYYAGGTDNPYTTTLTYTITPN